MNLQYQVRQNNEELQDFLKDLYHWEDEVQAKDKLLVNSKTPADPVSLMYIVYTRLKCTTQNGPHSITQLLSLMFLIKVASCEE